MANPYTKIIVKQGALELGRYELAPGQYIIGRDPACDIRVQARGIADRHVRLTCDGEYIEVEDLGSQTGTFLGGKRLQQPAQLDENGILHLGEVALEIQQTPDATPPQLPGVSEPAVTRLSSPTAATRPPTGKPGAPPAIQLTKSREHVYEMGGEVARGGMGAVHRAKDRNIERTVAMKVVLAHGADNEDLLQRFRQEAQLTGQLEHPNVVPIYDLAFDEQNRPFYTMKFVKGVTLHEILAKIIEGDPATLNRYTLTHLLTIFQKVCDAVAYAHSKGVVHRDLKPPNIMIGGYGEVLVMDWGLAKVLGGEKSEDRKPSSAVTQSSVLSPQSSNLTLSGTVMGSPQFMAPEQADGKLEEIDSRTDIFALGGILYNILTLHPPVSGNTIAEMLRKIREGEILPPDSYNAKTGRKKAGTIKVGTKTFPQPPLIPLKHCPGGHIPESLGAVAMKALAVRREDRYQSVLELQKDIEAYQGGFATRAENASVLKQVALLVKRHKKEFIIVHAALLVLVGGAVLFMVKVTKERNRAEAERQRAEVQRIRAEANEQRAQTERQRAEKTLVALHNTAPTYYEQAQTLIEQREWSNAMEKASIAASLAPEMADYHVLYGNLLQTSLRIAEARDAYTAALQRQPDHKLASENLALCQMFLRKEDGRNPYRSTSLIPIQMAMLQQGRVAEAGAFTRFIGQATTNRIEALTAWSNVIVKAGFDGRYLYYSDDGLQFNLSGHDFTNETLAMFQGMPLNDLKVGERARKIRDLNPLRGLPLHKLTLRESLITDFSPLQGMRLTWLDLARTKKFNDLTLLRGMPLESLDISCSAVSNLSLLQGMPLTTLRIGLTKVDDLTPLAGMRLTDLSIGNTLVSDLSPLRGMPLKSLILQSTPVSDLTPLKGMPLATLSLSDTTIKDFSALQGMPLTHLILSKTSIDDLTPLKGMPLKVLLLSECPVTDLNSLRGMPLQTLELRDCAKLQDLSPLADCRELEYLSIPTGCKNIEFLRSMPKLKRLGYKENLVGNGKVEDRHAELLTVAEFWKAYDAQKAASP